MSAEIEWEKTGDTEQGRLGGWALWSLIRDGKRTPDGELAPWVLVCRLPGVRSAVCCETSEAAKELAERQLLSFRAWFGSLPTVLADERTLSVPPVWESIDTLLAKDDQ